MKASRTLSLLIAAALPAVAVAAAPATQPQPIATTAAVAPQSHPPLQAIQDAQDPSAAIAAYAKALSQGADQIAAERVFLVRMTDFGLPEMADAQAQDLILRDPENGLAWGVAAHMSARRGNMAAAMGQIQTAVNYAPRDPFVLRTAGHIVAWYDSRGAGVDIPATISGAIPELKKRLADQQSYSMAYDEAMKDYQKPTDQQAVAQTEPVQIDSYSVPPSYAPSSGYAYDQPTVDYPAYSYYSYSSSPYWYPSYSRWCYPWYSSGVIVINGGHDHHHDGDHHDGDHHDGDHHDGDHHDGGHHDDDHHDGGHHDGDHHDGDHHDGNSRGSRDGGHNDFGSRGGRDFGQSGSTVRPILPERSRTPGVAGPIRPSRDSTPSPDSRPEFRGDRSTRIAPRGRPSGGDSPSRSPEPSRSSPGPRASAPPPRAPAPDIAPRSGSSGRSGANQGSARMSPGGGSGSSGRVSSGGGRR
jgi:hypothetical protein